MLSSANVRQRDKDLRAIAPPPTHTHTSPKEKYPPKHTSEGRPVLCPAARVPHEATPNHSEHTAGSSSPNCAGPRSGGRAGGGGGGAPQVRGPWAVGGRQRTQTSPAEHALLAISQPLSLSLSRRSVAEDWWRREGRGGQGGSKVQRQRGEQQHCGGLHRDGGGGT